MMSNWGGYIRNCDFEGKVVKRLGRQAAHVRLDDEREAIQVWETLVAVKNADGSVTLNSGGWHTPTTRRYQETGLKLFLEETGEHFRLGTLKRITYLSRFGNSWNDSRAEWNYQDGMAVYPDGHVEGAGNGDKERQLKKEIDDFVKLVVPPLPFPEIGDCWYCSWQTAENKSLGDALGSNDHLLSHVQEGYVHGSLLMCAMIDRGYRFPGFVLEQANAHAGDKYNHWLGGVHRALKRYLYNRLGLAYA